MMLLGPDIMEHAIDPSSVMGQMDAGMIGPALFTPDVSASFFVVMGKLIAARRVGEPDPGQVLPTSAIAQLDQIQSVMLDQFANEDEFDLVYKPLIAQLNKTEQAISRHDQDLDQRIRRFTVKGVRGIIALPATSTVEQCITALQQHCLANRITLDSEFESFIRHQFTFSDGQPAAFPSPQNDAASIPNEWITPDYIDQTTGFYGRQRWCLIW